ncbi:MAG: hypothetical protein ACKVT0_18100 [Planctomycetaceae bacterium]
MPNNPLNDVRAVRREISSECGNRADKVFDYYQSFQDKLKQAGRYQFVNTPLETIPTVPAKEPKRETEPK